MKKKKASKNWALKNNKDYYYRESKAQGFRSRSAFKLIEINKKFKFIKKNHNLLDLGSSPGGWSQVARKIIVTGKIMSVDLIKMVPINNVHFVQGNFSDPKIYNEIYEYFKKKIDIVISDMAANTTGNKTLDSYRTGELCLNAIKLSRSILSKDGIFVSKVFMGSSFDEIIEKSKKNFRNIRHFKPKSSKKESKEIYIICKGVLKI